MDRLFSTSVMLMVMLVQSAQQPDQTVPRQEIFKQSVAGMAYFVG